MHLKKKRQHLGIYVIEVNLRQSTQKEKKKKKEKTFHLFLQNIWQIRSNIFFSRGGPWRNICQVSAGFLNLNFILITWIPLSESSLGFNMHFYFCSRSSNISCFNSAKCSNGIQIYYFGEKERERRTCKLCMRARTRLLNSPLPPPKGQSKESNLIILFLNFSSL